LNFVRLKLFKNKPDPGNIGGAVNDQGESPARCLLVRTTATLAGAAFFLKVWSLVPTVPFPMSGAQDKAAAEPRRRLLLDDVVEAT
jgi:hypothetical protein